jgi:hypothetical protein
MCRQPVDRRGVPRPFILPSQLPRAAGHTRNLKRGERTSRVIEILSGARRWWNTSGRLTTAHLTKRSTMAKRNSMSTARRSRNREQEPITEPATPPVPNSGDASPAEPASPSSPADLSELVSEERTRLLKARAVLGCLAFALLYEDWLEPPDRPSFADAATAAQDLINATLDRLGGC